MELAPHIKRKSRFFNIIPMLRRPVANTIYPHIFLPPELYKSLIESNDPHPKHIALLRHEETHLQNQRKMRMLIYTLKYLFDKSFRIQEEIEGVVAGIKYLKDRQIPFEYEEGKKLSFENIYLWPLSKEYSTQQLAYLYQKI